MRALTGRLCRHLRKWWPETVACGLLGLIAISGAHGAAFLAGYTLTVGGIGWLLCLRHRHMPLEKVIRDIHAGMTRVEGKLDDAAPQGHAAPPLASVSPIRRA